MYLFAIFIILFAMSFPNVRAQTTSITNVQSPTHALTEEDVSVKVALTYDGGPNGAYVFVAIQDMDSRFFAVGNATSPQCIKSASGTNVATCFYIPASTSGSDVIAFNLQFYFLGMNRLQALVGFDDSAYQVISDSVSVKEFTILVTDRNLSLTVRVPHPVSVSIDGAQQNAGNVFTNVNLGTHTISVPDTVNVESGTRLRFDHWTDGETRTSRRENLQHDATFEAIYVTQHALTLESSQGSPTGAGWYDEGSSAGFSANATQPMSGVLGSLGGKSAFQGWYEGQSLVNKSSNASITMEMAHSLTARWAADYTIPLIVIGVIAGAVLVGITVIFLHRRRLTLTPQPVQVQPTPVQLQISRTVLSDKQFCPNCGAELPLNSKFCNKCGSAQT